MKNSSILRIGHRGAAGHAPENTIAAIEQGILLECDYVEFDVQSTVDNRLVIMHDKRVDRTTDGSGYASSMSFDQLRRLDAGVGQIIPSLEEVVTAADGRVGMMIEIITPGIAGFVVESVESVRKSSPVIYASFLHQELIEVRRCLPSSETLALLEGVPVNGAEFARAASVSYVGLGFDSVTPSFLHDLKMAGVKSFVYTLNDPRDIALAKTLEVSGIISDFPDRV